MAPIRSPLSLAITALFLLAGPAAARTDLEGCTYSDMVISPDGYAAYASRLWYDPDSGEVCEFLDCGGGRAPPKTTVPGCPLYEGTATYSPDFIDLPGATAQDDTAAATETAAATTTSSSRDIPTELPSLTKPLTHPPLFRTTSETSEGEAAETLNPNNDEDGAAGETVVTTSTPTGAGAMAAQATAGVVLGQFVAAGLAAAALM